MAADYQLFTVIGRLTRDPEHKTFQGGGGVVNIGLAFTGNTRKNQQTGKWEDEPCFMDGKAFINAEGRGLGDVIMRFCKKGSRVFVAGRIVLEQWADRNTGAKMRAHKFVIERLTLLDGKPEGGNSGGSGYGGNAGAAGRGGQHADSWGGGNEWDDGNAGGSQNSGYGGGNQNAGGAAAGGWGDDGDIPF
jgi:single-strand DNA-binding protein